MVDPRSPFAFGTAGRFLTSTHEREVFCCDGGDEGPYFIHEMPRDVAGVRNVDGGVLAIDAGGTLQKLVVPDGTVGWELALDLSPVALVATDAGRWVVVHEHGAIHGRGSERAGSIDVHGATGATFHTDGRRIAVVTAAGKLEVHDLDAPGNVVAMDIGSPCNSVAWSSLGWWIVAAEDGAHRVEEDASSEVRFLKWSGEPISRIAVSRGGGLCAFVTEEHYVVVFGVVKDINCGTIVYPERTAFELEFGPDNLLGVGLGLGDGNKIDLQSEGACWRTDPPPGRTRNRWMLQLSYETDDVERALAFERKYRDGKIRFEGRDMIVDDDSDPNPWTKAGGTGDAASGAEGDDADASGEDAEDGKYDALIGVAVLAAIGLAVVVWLL